MPERCIRRGFWGVAKPQDDRQRARRIGGRRALEEMIYLGHLLVRWVRLAREIDSEFLNRRLPRVQYPPRGPLSSAIPSRP